MMNKSLRLLLLLALPIGVHAAEHRNTYGAIESAAMGGEMHYSVYTPPDWESAESLPLVVVLHGAGSDHESFDRYGVGDYLDEKIGAGELPRAIIANPDGGLGFWENWADGSRMYRDWVIDELVPLVQEEFNTLPCPEQCHVTGFSMGGHGALRFAYYENDVFDSVAVVSALILSKEQAEKRIGSFWMNLFIPSKRIWGDIDDPAIPKELDPYVGWVESEALRDMRLLLSWGSRDKGSIVESGEAFRSHLVENNVDHAFYVYDGKHLWHDWKRVVGEALKFQVWNEAPQRVVAKGAE